jgi:hypothetical protein
VVAYFGYGFISLPAPRFITVACVSDRRPHIAA